MAPAFHLAFPVRDLDETRRFYGDVLGCRMGRSTQSWQDFDFFGHQLSAHVTVAAEAGRGAVDGTAVPIPHFGAVLDMPAWRALARRLGLSDIPFLLKPQIRFEGEPGEQGTFFLRDPSGNAIEFKGFRDEHGLFATEEGMRT